jgi:hypothetical protein
MGCELLHMQDQSATQLELWRLLQYDSCEQFRKKVYNTGHKIAAAAVCSLPEEAKVEKLLTLGRWSEEHGRWEYPPRTTLAWGKGTQTALEGKYWHATFFYRRQYELLKAGKVGAWS